MSFLHTHYKNLFVARNAPIEVIRAAYKALAQKYHPDRNKSGDAERVMKLINEAWDTLKDPELRRVHDEYIDGKLNTDTVSSQNRSAESPPRNWENSDNKYTSSASKSLAAELEPLAARLWFKNFTKRDIVEILKTRGLSEDHAHILVNKIFI